MISRLRKKFVIVAAAIITLVVSSVFIIVNLLNYYNIWDNGTNSIGKIKNNTTILNEIVSDEYFDMNKITADRGILIATLDSKGSVSRILSKNIQIDETSRMNLINAALENVDGQKETYVNNYKYEFVQYKDKNILFLVDVDRELKVFNLFLFNSLVVVSVIVLIVIVLLVFMSSRVIAPLAENVKKQKQFITYASHELKTPLAIISSNTDLLGIENGKSKWLRNIRKQVDRLSELIASLIEFSKAEEKDKVVKNKFSLSELVEDRLEDFYDFAEFNSKDINAKVEKNLEYNGEYDTILQVIDILLDNAIKYSDEESTINVELVNKGVPHLIVNNKSKFTKAGNLDVVFDRFYREEHSRESSQGYGLGLALAKLILDRHDARVKAYAKQDGEFTIEIKFK